MMKQLVPALAILFFAQKTTAQCNGTTGIPRFCLRWQNPATTAGGTKFEADIVLSGDVAFDLGSGNIQFTYNTAALTAPVLLSNNFTGYNFTAPPITHPTASVASLNFDLASVGNGMAIATAGTTLGRVQWTITDAGQNANLNWWYDDVAERTIVYEDTETHRLCATSTATTCLQPLSISLPLELLSFEVRPGAGCLRLFWETEGEQNLRGFDIERSSDGGLSFEKTGFAEARGGAFTQKYSHDDRAVAPGQEYHYRLRTLDFDEKEGFSPIRSGRLDGAATGGLLLFPNPVGGRLSVVLPENFSPEKLEITAADGRVMLFKTGFFEKEIDVTGLAEGVYFLKIWGAGGLVESGRFLKSR